MFVFSLICVFSVGELSGLKDQSSLKDSAHILSILQNAQSTFVKPIVALQTTISDEIERAQCNISQLRQLLEPCERISLADSPSEIALKFPHIINIIRSIWLNSQHYNTEAVITNLYRFVGNQIIRWCQQKIKIAEIFSGRVNEGSRLMESCIDCCVDYKAIYENLSTMDDESTVKWQLNDAIIFNHIDTFAQRLHDCMEICEGILVFGDGDASTAESVKLKFGGDRRDEFDRTCDAIESEFKEALRKIVDVSDDILDVHCIQWHNEIKAYRTVTSHLDAIVENLMTNVFLHVNGMEEGTYALACLHRYAQRVKLSLSYRQYVECIWEMFANEIATANQTLIDRFIVEALIEEAKFAGRVIHLQNARDRIKHMHSLLERATFLPETRVSDKILADYTRFLNAANASIQKQFDEWLQSIGPDVGGKLNQKLLLRSVSLPGLFECNIDPFVLDTFDEASTFKRLHFEFPLHVNQFFAKVTSTRATFDSIVDMCVAYNKIMKSISDKERLLMRPLIQICDHAILPGIHKLTWASDGLDAYIGECNRNIHDLNQFLTVYRKMNDRVVRYCVEICEVNVLKIAADEPDTLENITQGLYAFCQQQILTLLEHHNGIFRMLFEIYDALEAYLENVCRFGEHNWHQYFMLMNFIVPIVDIRNVERVHSAIRSNDPRIIDGMRKIFPSFSVANAAWNGYHESGAAHQSFH